MTQLRATRSCEGRRIHKGERRAAHGNTRAAECHRLRVHWLEGKT
ncbi:MAG TPA: hypothetical protein VEK77_12030 [Gemmatimonadales bacterium]|nr:hypothetical protein [Gemmatimonadales bacterium]